jgi:hypothetical protein
MNHNLFLNALQRAPLADRREAKAEWQDAITNQPQLVAERVAWLLNGCYGEEAYTAARQVVTNPRNAVAWLAARQVVTNPRNAVAWLAQAIAAHEWGCPPREAWAAWRALTAEEREAVNSAIRAAVDEVLAEQEQEE